MQLFLALGKLAGVVLSLAVQIGLLGAGAIPPAFQFGSNEGGIVQDPLDGLPDHRLNRCGLHMAAAMRRNDILKRWAGAAIVPVPGRIGGAVHRTPALPTAQPPAGEKVFILAVALGLDLVARELGLGGLEQRLVDDRRHGNRNPFLAWDYPVARLFVGVAFAR